jgi:cell division protein ZapA
MKQVEVTIMGQGYVLGCPAGGEALLDAAVASVDQEMSAIRDAGRIKARERIAVLAALNLAYRLAERAAPAAVPAPRPTTEAAPTGTSGSGAEAAALAALVRRIDDALGEDGHLL